MNKNNNYDVVIVGSGVAGLYAAINLSNKFKVLLVSKRELKLCNSALAQGGIAGVFENPYDNPEFHKKDTLVAGAYTNNLETLDILVNEASIDIGKLISLDVEFDKTDDGEYNRTLEGGHGKRRIFHYKDSTGNEIVSKLIEKLHTLENVNVLENALVCDIAKTITGFSLDITVDNKHQYYNTSNVVMATGGIGRVYEKTTNSAIATGDGITFAYELGVSIDRLNYIQFHPTAFNIKNTRECFLISEAVRGEGAYLRNVHGERFMSLYDERLELAPRDVVSQSIIKETERTNSNEIFLDITHKDSEYLKNRFPMIYKNLLANGYDLTKDLIPVFPCQHYLMGGIHVDSFAQTEIEGLYACGECSHTGVHGNNRLASNSLLEALVFSRRAAQSINEKEKTDINQLACHEFKLNDQAKPIPSGIRRRIRQIMQECYFVIPNSEKAKQSIKEVKGIMDMLKNGDFLVNQDYIEAKSLATIAFLILLEVK